MHDKIGTVYEETDDIISKRIVSHSEYRKTKTGDILMSYGKTHAT
jgi:hypothetical protein